MKFETPKSLREEHEALRAELLRASREPGAVGQAAAEVMRLLKPHFEKEEKFVMPPAALLERLAKGEIHHDMGEVLELTEQLKADYPAMLGEHEFIMGALTQLIDAARKHDQVEFAELAHRLLHHARLEEEVIYPACLVVGELVALKLGLKKG